MTDLCEYLNQHIDDKELIDLIITISQQAKPIRDAFIENQNYSGTTNASGETQAEMDKWSDEHIVNVLNERRIVKTIASEERDDIVSINPDAKYSVVMDPLDGSSLISVNLCVGTIVGIYEGGVLQAGRNLKAAFYMLYGPMTTITITAGSGVAVFALDVNGIYRMIQDNVVMPDGKIYGSGGLRTEWSDKHKKFISDIENDGAKCRYSGSFVADFHQVLHYGGLYAYPPLAKSPSGKLRLLFEANPIGFIAVQAGGMISNGESSTLDIVPETVHQRTPIYVGSRNMIEKIESM